MPVKPITRHYNYGCTFRWIQGDSHIVVKRGYVCEGMASIVRFEPKHYTVYDRTSDDPHNDKHTWIATIPADPARCHDDAYLRKAAHDWAMANRQLANIHERTDVRPDPRSGSRGV